MVWEGATLSGEGSLLGLGWEIHNITTHTCITYIRRWVYKVTHIHITIHIHKPLSSYLLLHLLLLQPFLPFPSIWAQNITIGSGNFETQFHGGRPNLTLRSTHHGPSPNVHLRLIRQGCHTRLVPRRVRRSQRHHRRSLRSPGYLRPRRLWCRIRSHPPP